MKNKIMCNLIYIVLLVSLALLPIGCGTGDGSTTTDFLSGIGYNISLTVPKTVNPGNSALIKVDAKDPAGLPVPDGTTITLNAAIGDLDPNEVTTINGSAVSTYIAPKDEDEENPSATVKDTISAYCLGAIVWTSEVTIPQGF